MLLFQLSSINDDDPVSTVDNAYEAILLGVKRIGHGLGLIKHPYLLELIKQRQIPIEINPVSNQLLGYTPDIRTHPGLTYFRQDVPVVLGADDPGTFGVDHFTVDWYQVFTGWGLDLADLKKLAQNSLKFSSMTKAQKQRAINNKWLPKWNEYILEKKQIACEPNVTTNYKAPYFSSIFPQFGAIDGTTHVHVFGRHFESAICQDVICSFGGKQSPRAHYVSPNHLICESPEPEMGNEEELEVSVEVSLDGGVTYQTHPSTFIYKYALYTAASTNVVSSTCLLIIMLVLYKFIY